jgi:hypothetical protein
LDSYVEEGIKKATEAATKENKWKNLVFIWMRGVIATNTRLILQRSSAVIGQHGRLNKYAAATNYPKT